MRKSVKKSTQDSHWITHAATLLHQSLLELGAHPSKALCEDIAILVIKAMSTRNRAFHDPSHAFDVASVSCPTGKIAGLFHDLVYIQVDRSRLPEIRKTFSVFDPGEALSLKIPSSEVLRNDPWRLAIVEIFGFAPHSEIGPFTGLNEFLSAWIAVSKLRDCLDKWSLLQVVACIEATIPFRGPDSAGRTPSELLRHRLVQAAKIFHLQPSEKSADTAIQNAVAVANQDVINFGDRNAPFFVGNSWSLLLEGNPPLQGAMFTAQEYRDALFKMCKFFSTLSPEKVFRQYKGFPSSKDYSELVGTARNNISVGIQYIQIQLIEKTILDALAQLTGGTCPYENWVGDRRRTPNKTLTLAENFLDPKVPEVDPGQWNPQVLKILEEGRETPSYFDSRTDLIGAYIYRRSTREDISRYLSASTEMIEEKLPPKAFLQLFKPDLIHALIQSFAQVAWTRREELLNLVDWIHAPDTTRKAA